jgi:hypothetical protein
MAIDGASTQLVNEFAQQVATPGSDLRTLIQQNIVDKLSALGGSNPQCLWARLPATKRSGSLRGFRLPIHP